MPIGEIDFDGVKEGQSFSPAPEGDYIVQIMTVEEKNNKFGDYFWLTLRIVDEEYKGKRFWDKLQFHEENSWGLPRTKLVLSRFGIDVSGKVGFDDPEKLLLGRCAVASLKIEEYESNKFTDDGEPIMREKNVVDYAGYEKVKKDFVAPTLDDIADAGLPAAGDDITGESEGGGEDDLPFEFE